MKLILVIAAIIQACVLYLLVGFGINALWAKMNGYENWKEWYREENESYILCLIFWPYVAVLIVALGPVDLIKKVLDDLIGNGKRCENVCKPDIFEKTCEAVEPLNEKEKICENCYWNKWYRGDLYCTHVGLKTNVNSSCWEWKPKEEKT